jgi:hypothetical protein
MKEQTDRTGFWLGGAPTFREELDREEGARLAPLKAELEIASTPDRKEVLKRVIAAVKAEFDERRRAARSSLFAAR